MTKQGNNAKQSRKRSGHWPGRALLAMGLLFMSATGLADGAQGNPPAAAGLNAEIRAQGQAALREMTRDAHPDESWRLLEWSRLQDELRRAVVEIEGGQSRVARAPE